MRKFFQFINSKVEEAADQIVSSILESKSDEEGANSINEVVAEIFAGSPQSGEALREFTRIVYSQSEGKEEGYFLWALRIADKARNLLAENPGISLKFATPSEEQAKAWLQWYIRELERARGHIEGLELSSTINEDRLPGKIYLCYFTEELQEEVGDIL